MLCHRTFWTACLPCIIFPIARILITQRHLSCSNIEVQARKNDAKNQSREPSNTDARPLWKSKIMTRALARLSSSSFTLLLLGLGVSMSSRSFEQLCSDQSCFLAYSRQVLAVPLFQLLQVTRVVHDCFGSPKLRSSPVCCTGCCFLTAKHCSK